MANQKCITDNDLSRLARDQEVERLYLDNEIRTLIAIASHARDYLDEGAILPPKDFTTCVEELTEVMESIDTKSLQYEKRALTLQRKRSRLRAKLAHHQETES